MKKIKLRSMLAVFTALVIGISLCSCAAPSGTAQSDTKAAFRASALSDGYVRGFFGDRTVDADFADIYSEFSFALFDKLLTGEGENLFISPFSVMTCLGMIANGARGETKAQLEAMLGADIDTLNRSLAGVYDRLCAGGVFTSANSMWLRRDITLKPGFLQANADHYGADIFATDFDKSTLADIDRWVSEKTDGMIEKFSDGLDPDYMIALFLNAVCFDAEWAEEYVEDDISDGSFRNRDGSKTAVKMLSSTEYTYMASRTAAGFAKKYRGADGAPGFSFVGIMPKDRNADIYKFARSLDASSWAELWGNRGGKVEVKLPEFSFDCREVLNDALKALGAVDMFDYTRADFGDASELLGACDSVLHKTHIEVDRDGTRAAAVTGATYCGGMNDTPVHRLVFDRPFVFMIVDDATGIPLFVGVTANIATA